jgi:hypothetical protein
MASDVDADRDAVTNDQDSCPSSDLSATILINGCDSGVANRVFLNGCTLADLVNSLVADPANGARNFGQFASRFAHGLNQMRKTGLISGREHSAIQKCAQ